MEVIINGSGDSKPFPLKIGRFDSVRKIKERIEEQQGIPISKQTLCFNDEILPDDFNVRSSRIVNGSTLLLLPPLPSGQEDIDKNPFRQPLPADHSDLHYLDNVDLNLSLLNHLLKSPTDSKISDQSGKQLVEDTSTYIEKKEVQTTPVTHKQPDSRESTVESKSGRSLEKTILKETITVRKTRRISEIMTDSDEKPQPETYEDATLRDSEFPQIRKLCSKRVPRKRRLPNMSVFVRWGGQQSAVPVHRDDPVTELKRIVRLPDPCFFIHGQRLVEEDQSFGWNQVNHGDVIESFAGSIQVISDSSTDTDPPDSRTPSPSTSPERPRSPSPPRSRSAPPPW